MTIFLRQIDAVNNTPLLVEGVEQPTGVTVFYQGSYAIPTCPAMFLIPQGKPPPATSFPTLKVTVSNGQGAEDQPVYLTGAFEGGTFTGQGVLSASFYSSTLQVGLMVMAPPGGAVLLQSPVSWTLYAGNNDQGSVLATFVTRMELYLQPTGALQPNGGQPAIELNALRMAAAAYLPSSFMPTFVTEAGLLMATVAACTRAAFVCPPAYGASAQPAANPGNYYNYANQDFDLASWLLAIRGVTQNPLPALCFDCAAAVNVFIALQDALDGVNVWGAYLVPFGAMMPGAYEALRGAPGQTRITAFTDHMVTVVNYPYGPLDANVCDATLGPYVGSMTPAVYLWEVLNTSMSEPAPTWGQPPSGPRPVRMTAGAVYLVNSVNGQALPRQYGAER